MNERRLFYLKKISNFDPFEYLTESYISLQLRR